MKIRFRCNYAGPQGAWMTGETADISPPTAMRLVEQQLAELVDDPRVIETTSAEPAPEQAVSVKRTRRKRQHAP